MNLDTERTRLNPSINKDEKSQEYFLHIIRYVCRLPSTLGAYLSHSLHSNNYGNLPLLHQLQIETWTYESLKPKICFCQLCSLELERGAPYICLHPIFYEIRGQYHCIFREDFGPLQKIMSFRGPQTPETSLA